MTQIKYTWGSKLKWKEIWKYDLLSPDYFNQESINKILYFHLIIFRMNALFLWNESKSVTESVPWLWELATRHHRTQESLPCLRLTVKSAAPVLAVRGSVPTPRDTRHIKYVSDKKLRSDHLLPGPHSHRHGALMDRWEKQESGQLFLSFTRAFTIPL